MMADIKKFPIDIMMADIKPVVTETGDFEFRDFSRFLEFWKS